MSEKYPGKTIIIYYSNFFCCFFYFFFAASICPPANVLSKTLTQNFSPLSFTEIGNFLIEKMDFYNL